MVKRKVVEIVIKLKDGVSATLGKVRSSISQTTQKFKDFGNAVTGVFSKIKGGINSIKSGMTGIAKRIAKGFALVSVGAVALGASIKKAFDFETAKMQLEILLGSVKKATDRFNELKRFSSETPFQLPDILKASRLMSIFSENVMGGAKSMTLIGDAAASVNENISDVAFWFGRAYSLIQAGKPFGEAAMRLQEMGIVSAEGAIALKELQDSGASADKIFKTLTNEFSRFEGGMIKLSQTGNGLISTLKDNWTIAVATFGEAFMDAAKGGIQDMIDAIRSLVADGTITKWAEQAKAALDSVLLTIKLLASNSDTRGKVLQSLGKVLRVAFKTAAQGAVEVLLKYAPKVGAAIAKGVGDLLGLDLKPKDLKEQESYLAELKRELKGIQRGGGGRAGERAAEFRRLNIDPLEAKIKAMTKAWEEGRIEMEAVDLPKALKEFKMTLDKLDANLDESLPDQPLAKIIGKAVEKGAKEGVKEGAESASTTAAQELSPSTISKGIGAANVKESSQLMKSLMRGQEGLSRRESLGAIRELIKSGGAGQLGAAEKVMRELMKGQNGLNQGQALGVVRELIKRGGLGSDPSHITDLIDQLSKGQDGLSKPDISRALVELFGTEEGRDAMGGAKVGAPTMESQMGLANGYLKQIAENTEGGLF